MSISDYGPPDAKIMIVGDAPGDNESNRGIPFIGQGGKLLKAMLEHCGINYEECYSTYVCNTQAPGRNFSNFYEDSKCRVPSKFLEERKQ